MNTHDRPLRILLVEDSADDADLEMRAIRQAGLSTTFERVETSVHFVTALARESWDIIISDFGLPGFSGLDALRIARARDTDIPFIVVSGTIGEERAVELVKAGANDYVMKHNLTRLATAVEREVREAGERRSRRTVEEAAMRLLAAIEQTGEGVALARSNGTIEYANPTFSNITGCLQPKEEDAVGILFPDTDDRRCQEARNAVTNQMPWSGRFTTKRENGDEYVLDLKIHPVANGHSDSVGMVVVARDVSVESKMEIQLRQAQRLEAIGTLAGGIAHDFNNILSAMLGYTEIVARDLPDESDSKSCLDKVLKAGDRARKLIRQILTISRTHIEERVPLHVQYVLDEAVEFLQASLPSTIQLHANTDPGCPMVLADPTQINQIIMNLCTNAAHAMRDRGGAINIRVSTVDIGGGTLQRPKLSPGRYIKLTVDDTGHGMDKQTMDRIFDPFFTTKAVGEGTGLGLATVYSIVTGAGGTIDLSSRVGEGTTFEVYLPSCENAVATPTTPDEIEIHGNQRVLVVDDEETLSNLMKLMLSDLGYEVTTANSGQEALAVLQANPGVFDLLITDQTMPAMTGIELARKAKSMQIDIPVVLVSGLPGLLTPDSQTDLEIDGILAKPYDLESLGVVVRRAMDKANDRSAAA